MVASTVSLNFEGTCLQLPNTAQYFRDRIVRLNIHDNVAMAVIGKQVASVWERIKAFFLCCSDVYASVGAHFICGIYGRNLNQTQLINGIFTTRVARPSPRDEPLDHGTARSRKAVKGRPPKRGAPRASVTLADRIGLMQELAARDGYIYFYGDKHDTNEVAKSFGNFFVDRRNPITLNIRGKDHTFQCAEAAFHAQKFPSYEAEYENVDGDEALQLARLHQDKLPADWHTGGKDRAMLAVLRQKFKRGSALAKLLVASGDAYLVEHRPKRSKSKDTYWSDGHDGTGTNMLGQMLMQIRGELGGTGVVRRHANYDRDLSKLR
jgi:ribA/ribD-fused uncharacterized protein